MGEKIINLSLDIAMFPYLLVEKNKHKWVRAIGMLCLFPWVATIGGCVFVIIFLIGIVIEMFKEA